MASSGNGTRPVCCLCGHEAHVFHAEDGSEVRPMCAGCCSALLQSRHNLSYPDDRARGSKGVWRLFDSLRTSLSKVTGQALMFAVLFDLPVEGFQWQRLIHGILEGHVLGIGFAILVLGLAIAGLGLGLLLRVGADWEAAVAALIRGLARDR